jgi:HEAT repeat protein
MELATLHARAPSSEDRTLAVELAARAGSAEASSLVVAALQDPDPAVRRTAASAMATLRATAAVPALSRSLSDPQAEVRVEAIRALGVIDDDTVPAVLIGALRDPEVRVREMAADALARWHSPAVAKRLAAALASPDVRRAASEVLSKMGSMAVQALAEVATGDQPEAAKAAGQLLDQIAGPGPFIERLSSIEPDERLQAVLVLAALGGPSACEAMLPALSDPDVRVRSRAASALGTLGYLPALKQLRRMFLTDPVASAAGAAEDALRRLGAVPTGDDVPED